MIRTYNRGIRKAPRRVLRKTTEAKIRVVALGFKRKEPMKGRF